MLHWTPRVPRVWAAWVPVTGVGAFIALYFCAASLYPGGTWADHESLGYSHLSNYWCDLLRRVSHSGAPNPGRSFAVLGTIILPLSLVPLWLQVPVLFRDGSRSRRIVQLVGPASMVLSTLIFTSIHDLAVNVAAILGFIAVLVTTLSLTGGRRKVLLRVAAVALTLGVANYLMWHADALLWAMPTVQKGAFAAFFLWIVVASGAVRHAVARAGQMQSTGELPMGIVRASVENATENDSCEQSGFGIGLVSRRDPRGRRVL